jgi:hypothetical protein
MNSALSHVIVFFLPHRQVLQEQGRASLGPGKWRAPNGVLFSWSKTKNFTSQPRSFESKGS